MKNPFRCLSGESQVEPDPFPKKHEYITGVLPCVLERISVSSEYVTVIVTGLESYVPTEVIIPINDMDLSVFQNLIGKRIGFRLERL